MKVVLLAGGIGSRLSEETYLKPKPLIEIGNMPIIWHIMMIYSHHGFNDFIICCGYKGYLIKEYFANYFLHLSDVEIDVSKNSVNILNKKLKRNWKITLVDTGEETQTGGRIKKVKKYLNSTFLMTYGDGLSNVNINKLLHFHKKNKSLATMTVVNPPSRFGSVQLKKNLVTKFSEKPIISNSWINGGYFVLEPKIFDYIRNKNTIWEKEPLQNLSKNKKLNAYLHKDFWQPMDTLRDRNFLNDLWNSGNAPWKLWK
ncbi:glucose-1-phosphate cytidylyltransferase [Candidatus Pelagibacter sp.]|nr:glucose-1-phosphate cytidylyltransferase [Candidatus Pelagibacter sp.]